PLSICVQRAGPPRASDGWHGLVGAEGRTAMTLIPQTSEPVSEDIGDSSSHRSPVCGDSEPLSFDEYVATRAAALVRFTMLLTGDLHRAEDLVQEALARAYLAWGRIRRRDDPDVYLHRILVNASRSWWRRRHNREVPVEQPAEQVAPGDLGAETAERDAMRRLIARLPHRQRAVLVLRYYEDLDYDSIAQM